MKSNSNTGQLIAKHISCPETTTVASLKLPTTNKVALSCTPDDAELIAFGLFCATDTVTTTNTKVQILELAEAVLQALVELEQPKTKERLEIARRELGRYKNN